MVDKQGIITAMKNSDLFLKVLALQGATMRVNGNGSPYVFTGGFNMVFQLNKGGKKWAFRVWHVPMKDSKERFQKISHYLTALNLPYFADFVFDEKGLIVNGEALDTIRMEWVEGSLLKKYLEDHLTDKVILQDLATQLSDMCKTLRDNQISHGDLQEGNILIDAQGHIKLVDYDSVCIPSLEGGEESVTGLKGYQHPSRFTEAKASLRSDYFSELIIYLSILGIAENPSLWDKYTVKDTSYLLFTPTDFESLERSAIYQDLKGLSPEIDRLLFILADYLRIPSYLDLQPFSTYLAPPVIRKFTCDASIIARGGSATIVWEVGNAQTVELNMGIGKIAGKGEMEVRPDTTVRYILKATGYFESITGELDLTIFPMPMMQFIPVSMPELSLKGSVPPIRISAPRFDVSFKFEGLSLARPLFPASKPYVGTFQPMHFPRTHIFNIRTAYDYITRKISGRRRSGT